MNIRHQYLNNSFLLKQEIICSVTFILLSRGAPLVFWLSFHNRSSWCLGCHYIESCRCCLVFCVFLYRWRLTVMNSNTKHSNCIYVDLNWVVLILNAIAKFCITMHDRQPSSSEKYMKPKEAATRVHVVFCYCDNICFAGQPQGWALVSPGISPTGRLDGVRETVLSSPSIRLYKYSIYDGKVGKQILFQPIWEEK